MDIQTVVTFQVMILLNINETKHKMPRFNAQSAAEDTRVANSAEVKTDEINS